MRRRDGVAARSDLGARHGACLAIGLLCWPLQLSGQLVVTGRVTGNGSPVAGAEVSLTPHAVTAITAVDGRYVLTVPSPGQAALSVRAIGFQSTSRRFIFAGRDSLVVNFSLARATQVLEPVTVTGAPAVGTGRMQGFEIRRERGTGQYFTRADLAAHGSAPLSGVLRTAKNLQLFRRPAECGGGFTIGTGRGQDRLTMGVQETLMLGCSGNRFACFPAIYLDGMSFWIPGTPGPPDVDAFRSDDLEAIEIYRGPGQVPPEYNSLGSSCGVILLWTRAGGGGE